MRIGFRALQLQCRVKADLGGVARYLPYQYKYEPYLKVDGREGLRSRLTGMGNRSNLAAEAIVLVKSSPPYEIYRMQCLPSNFY